LSWERLICARKMIQTWFSFTSFDPASSAMFLTREKDYLGIAFLVSLASHTAVGYGQLKRAHLPHIQITSHNTKEFTHCSRACLKVNVKFTLEEAMKAHRHRRTALLFL
jgi:hypothetical protein